MRVYTRAVKLGELDRKIKQSKKQLNLKRQELEDLVSEYQELLSTEIHKETEDSVKRFKDA